MIDPPHFHLRSYFGCQWPFRALPPSATEDQKTDEPAPFEALPEELFVQVLHSLDTTTLIIATGVNIMWEKKIKRVLWEARMPVIQRNKTIAGHLIEFLDEVHFPLRYGTKFPKEKEALQKLIPELNEVPKTALECIYPNKCYLLKLKEILKTIPKAFLEIAQSSIVCSRAKLYFDEEGCADVKKIQECMLATLFEDPQLLSLITLNERELLREKWKQKITTHLIEREEKRLWTLMDPKKSPEFCKQYGLLNVKDAVLLSWVFIRKQLNILHEYDSLFHSYPTTQAEAKRTCIRFNKIVDQDYTLELAWSLLKRFTNDPKYYDSSDRSFSSEKLDCHNLGNQLLNLWGQKGRHLARKMIERGNFQNAFKSSIPLIKSGNFDIIEEIGITYSDLGQTVHTDSIIDLLDQTILLVNGQEQKHPDAKMCQLSLIYKVGMKWAKKGNSQEANAYVHRLDRALQKIHQDLPNETRRDKILDSLLLTIASKIIPKDLETKTPLPSEYMGITLSIIEMLAKPIGEEKKQQTLSGMLCFLKMNCKALLPNHQEAYDQTLQKINALLA